MLLKLLRAIAALLVPALCLLACGDGATPAPADEPWPTPDDGTEVTIAHVIDGDTAELSDGHRVRYVGINTPERGQPFYEEATEANRQLTEGKKGWMVLDAQTTDRYGRVLAYLWVDGRFINIELVRQGYANAYTEPPNVRYSEEIVAAEQEAREAQIGLWSLAGIPIKIEEIHFDAPGPDHENPNGEWVALKNEGTEAIDLAGFTLKDGANHIYAFPPVRLEADGSLRLYSGRGQDSGDALYWGLSGDAVWSNQGDAAYLRDPQGQLVDYYSY
jgi:micrococcal nuclease